MQNDNEKSKKNHWLLGIILLASFLLMVFSAASDSMVVDEKVHIPAGYLHVWQGNYLFNSEHPPLLNDLAGLFAQIARPNVPEIPEDFTGGDQWEYGDLFFYESGNNLDEILLWARLPFILLSLALIYLTFVWAKTLFGPKAGLMAATLAAFSPNILAHGRLATTDSGLVFFFVLACFLLWKYLQKPNYLLASLLGLAAGLTILSKFSGLIILPIMIIGLLSFWLSRKIKFSSAVRQGLLIFIIPLVLSWAVYVFSMRSDLAPTSTYVTSRTLGSQVISSDFSKWLIAPLDKYFQGMEILADHNTGGHWAYLNGEVGYTGWWQYFPLVLWYKLTLAELILLFLSIFAFFRFKERRLDDFWVIFPPLLFLAISITGKIDIGIRHILPILPFFYIFISRLVKNQNLIFRNVFLILALAQIIIGILAFPNYIAYFNQLAGGGKSGIRHLADSNLDWHQNMKRFGKYAKKNNIKKVYELCWDSASFTYQGIESEILPNTPVNGAVVICAQQLVVTPDGFEIGWVTKYPPDDIVANAMYVWRFDLKPMELR